MLNQRQVLIKRSCILKGAYLNDGSIHLNEITKRENTSITVQSYKTALVLCNIKVLMICHWHVQ